MYISTIHHQKHFWTIIPLRKVTLLNQTLMNIYILALV